MAGFRQFITSMMVISLFSVFCVGFAISFLGVTNPDSTLISGSESNLTSSFERINQSLHNATKISSSIERQFLESEPSAVDYLYLIFQAAFYIPKTIVTVGISTIYAVGDMVKQVGVTAAGESIVITYSLMVLISILVITLVLLGIKAIRTGETER